MNLLMFNNSTAIEMMFFRLDDLARGFWKRERTETMIGREIAYTLEEEIYVWKCIKNIKKSNRHLFHFAKLHLDCNSDKNKVLIAYNAKNISQMMKKVERHIMWLKMQKKINLNKEGGKIFKLIEKWKYIEALLED